MKRKSIFLLLCMFLLTSCGQEPEPESEPEPNFIQIPEITEPASQQTPPISTQEPTVEETKPPAPETVYLNHQDLFEVQADVTIADFITSANVTITDEVLAMPVDTSHPGSFEITVPYLYGDETREEILSYQVRDTTPPVILNEGYGAFIKTGEVFDLRELIGYGDNYDTQPTLTYEGEVNTEIPGNYMLSAYLTDSSGNQSNCRLNVLVADEKPLSESRKEKLTFEDIASQYETSAAIPGVDISKWQGYVDFDAMKEAGCEFVIMRIGSSSGYPSVDDYFERNFRDAKEAGLKVGVYFYTTDVSESQIREDADWIVSRLDGAKLDFPIAFDWEDFQHFQQYDINLHQLNALYHAFADELEQNGYDTMLYASKFFLETVWENPNEEYIWLAHYTEKTNYTGKYRIWQRSDSCHVDGIEGNADVNILYPESEMP